MTTDLPEASTGDDELERHHRLLERLAEHGQPPGHAYERLRGRLIRFFRLHVPTRAEELADCALDRLAHKLEQVTVEHPGHYALGIARHLVQEHAAERKKAARMMQDPCWRDPPETDDADEAADRALEACLRTLTAGDRELLLEYYRHEGAARIRARRGLAGRLEISINALRNRALRLRRRLEQCMREHIGSE